MKNVSIGEYVGIDGVHMEYQYERNNFSLF